MTLAELLVAVTVTTAVMSGVLQAGASAQRLLVTQSEAADAAQRLRVGVDVLTRELLPATLVLPYGRGGPALDAITIRQGATRHVYYLAADAERGALQLRHYDGALSDLPVLEGLAAMAIEYAGEAGEIPLSELTDGPWLPHAGDADRFDADLLRVRRVRVHLTASGGRARDVPLTFDVAPRNLDGGP